MTSIVCPKCKSKITVWDINCLNCGYHISNEDRAMQAKEQEELYARKKAEKIAAHARSHKHAHTFQMKLDRLSLGLLHANIDVVSVFIISIFLLAIAALLMLL